MDTKILIVAPKDDTHALVVQKVLDTEFDIEAIIWDTSRLNGEEFLTFCPNSNSDLLYLNLSDRTIDSSHFHSIWWRRVGKLNFSKEIHDKKIVDFCAREYSTLFHGAFASLKSPVINSPHAESLANRKPYQLLIAKESGLIIPNTIISNDPSRIRAFWEENYKNCIYKTLTPASDRFLETRRLNEEDFCDFDKLRYAPIIVQERIEGLDIRVNVFGQNIFASSIKVNLQEANTDWRLDMTSKWEEYEISMDLQLALLSFLRKLDLHYGCIDMRIQPDGRPVFLEINPAGQFLFIEIDTGQPLTKAFASLLLNPELK